MGALGLTTGPCGMKEGTLYGHYTLNELQWPYWGPHGIGLTEPTAEQVWGKGMNA